MFESTPIIHVSDVNSYIKSILSNTESLKYIRVKGEISNFKAYPSGHLYFSLKDQNSFINAVMFSNYAKRIAFHPKDGDEVVVLASVDVYVPRGSYNLNIFEMEEVGLGQQLVEFEKLKKQLASEGLFDESRKRTINIYPKAIGVITAPNGAAIRDIVTNIRRRYPIAEIYVFPSLVQGEQAPESLIRAFQKSQEYDLDTLIIGRGGGASEDLSAFNNEKLVREVAKSKIPIIAAVGHEIDVTLIDYIADKRASTPTGAAELATVDRREIENFFSESKLSMEQTIYDYVNERKEDIYDLSKQLNESTKELLKLKKDEVEKYTKQLEILNPRAILSRGYSISIDESGRPIRDIKKLKPKQIVHTILESGSFDSEIKNIKEE